MYVCLVHLALNNVQVANVAARLAWIDRYHTVFGLEQPTHDVQHSGLTDSLGLFNVVPGERRVGGYQEMCSWSRDERGNDATEIIVHIRRISEGSSGCGHDSGNLQGVSDPAR